MSAGKRPQQQVAPQPALQQRRQSILVVDDEPVLRDLCARALDGYRVLEAENGRQALTILETEQVDVVLSDVMMPQMDGLDLLRRIRERDPDQVVVMMTGYGDREVVLRALKLDADDFLTKPVDPLQLTTVIRKTLEKKVLREELLRARKGDRLKTEFLGLVSHKLKTPVTVISLFLQNLARELPQDGMDVCRQNLPLIQRETDYLAELIQGLLYYSEKVLAAGRPRIEPIELHGPLKDCLDEIELRVRAAGIRLSTRFPDRIPPVRADRERLVFCLRALLDNAVKFTPCGGRIEIGVERADNRVLLHIADDGPGIDPKELGRVFDKFHQVDPQRTGQVPGFGLGLYYTREFCRAMGGDVRLDSTPGKGTRATLVLPTGDA
ncbi:signal transduction histidine kinase [Geothermobacter ehrlichii]|uniref:histidine kinase n=1 Tax=Geothermobacter ehrlichii TaxID=213224 RepID=A0A5D3WIQ0_9BACT|nr:response regulator [Geothermobacter ehrlichii]TYO97492.1 signal transduction histidine kinase [Geothermobacter ehrlichii]